MKRLILAAGVAALAISAPVAAERGGGRGKDRPAKVERGGGKAAKADRSGRKQVRAERGPRREARGQRGGGGRQMRLATMQREDRGNRPDRAERRRGGDRKAVRAENRGRGNDRDAVRVQRRGRDDDRRVAVQRRGRDDDRRVAVQRRGRDDDRRVVFRERNRDRDDGRRVVIRDRDRSRDVIRIGDWNDDRWRRRLADRGYPAGFAGGCPPGLAKQNELCMPPGQYKKLVGQRISRLNDVFRVPVRLRDIYRDTDDYYYRYGNGYLYRVDRDRDVIRALLPLFGLGYGIGEPFPYNSPAYYVPSYYQPFYPSYGNDYYRYSNGYVYEIDGRSGLIEDIIPLYDHGYGIGQMLPASYSYYNLPYPYRSHYVDDDDYFYRYAPGAIYRVDAETQLITAIVSLLTGSNGLAVGQPLPIGYSAYNVPFDYRSRYYDSPSSWYRYSNGYIYQVDPQTRLVTALVRAIT